MSCCPWLRIAITIGACLAPAAAQCQDAGAPTGSVTGVLRCTPCLRSSRSNISGTAPYYTIRERIYRKVLGEALGNQLDYYSELLNLPLSRSVVRVRLRRLPGAQVCRPPDRLLIANGPDAAALAGRIQAQLLSQPPIVFVEHERGGQFRSRPAIHIGGHSKSRWIWRCGYIPRPATCLSCAAISARCTKRG